MSDGPLLEGRVAVITGAGSGIGRVVAEAFAREGARLALVGRRQERLEETAGLCAALRPSAGTSGSEQPLLMAADVGREADVDRLREAVAAAYGRCDVLVSNAGVFKPPPGVLLHESPVEDWDEVMSTNVRGAFLCLRAFAPMMIAQRYGRVILTTSGLKHAPGHGVYSVSKSALDAFSRTAAQELRKFNILVNTLNPGWVRTEMAKSAQDDPHKVVPVLLRMATLPDEEPSGVEFQA